MSAREACMPVELLSSYLDHELDRGESLRVERHLAACPGCRTQLASLRRVVDNLRRLERSAPPPTLAQHVQRRVALDRSPTSRLRRFEAELQRLRPRLSIFLPFAVVFALAAILLLFTDRLDRDRNRGPVVVIPPPEAVEAFGDPDRELRRLEVFRQAGGRSFQREGDAWHQIDLPPGAPQHDIAADSEAGRALLAENPWLNDLLADSGSVAFTHGREIAVIASSRPDGSPPKPPPP